MKRKKIMSKKSDVKELIVLYWRKGKLLSMKIDDERWGAKILEKLARDIRNEFPEITGFSLRNMHYMRKFAGSYPDPNCAAAAAQIPWGRNMVLLDKLDNTKEIRASNG